MVTTVKKNIDKFLAIYEQMLSYYNKINLKREEDYQAVEEFKEYIKSIDPQKILTYLNLNEVKLDQLNANFFMVEFADQKTKNAVFLLNILHRDLLSAQVLSRATQHSIDLTNAFVQNDFAGPVSTVAPSLSAPVENSIDEFLKIYQVMDEVEENAFQEFKAYVQQFPSQVTLKFLNVSKEELEQLNFNFFTPALADDKIVAMTLSLRELHIEFLSNKMVKPYRVVATESPQPQPSIPRVNPNMFNFGQPGLFKTPQQLCSQQPNATYANAGRTVKVVDLTTQYTEDQYNEAAANPQSNKRRAADSIDSRKGRKLVQTAEPAMSQRHYSNAVPNTAVPPHTNVVKGVVSGQSGSYPSSNRYSQFSNPVITHTESSKTSGEIDKNYKSKSEVEDMQFVGWDLTKYL
ncbi:Uncharacterised protein [Legionella busanensis]|uniref:Uncharacterized protein n=1 Tax=Legionella busanensis TaxID=190655 RepID=A0A378JIS3_9GAMM|nr:hypothetical protein [Legionella busanensis]STX51054.1 Uncharacterised protein [Legionella busanensis]